MLDTSVTLFFGDGERKLQLTAPLVIELERKCNAGIGAIARRLFANEQSFTELVEIIRLALVGGGTDPAEANALVTTYVYVGPLMPHYETASAIMIALFYGKAPDPIPALDPIPAPAEASDVPEASEAVEVL